MASRRQHARARALRKNQTDVEGLIWQYLSDRQLGGFKFRRQHPIRTFVVDFYCVEKKVVVELDGSQHGDQEHRLQDARRTAVLEEEGIRVLRFWDYDVLTNTDRILDEILENLEER